MSKMGKVNYLINMLGRRKRNHVNMVKDFHVHDNQGYFEARNYRKKQIFLHDGVKRQGKLLTCIVMIM